jgi:signal peptidase II
VLIVWTAGILAVDQATKAYAIANLQPTGAQPISYANDLFRIQYAENPGAFLSLMRDWPPQARFWVLTVINGAVLAFVGLLLLVKRPADAWMWHALALIMAGGLGNLIDRIRFDSHVIDFMNVGVGGLRTGIFNVADMAITAGFLMLLPMLFAGSDKTLGSDKSQVTNPRQIPR